MAVDHNGIPHNYMFSEVPDTEEGREFIRLARKFLNRDRYELTMYGQHLKEGENPKHFRYGPSLKASTHRRIYIYEKKKFRYEREDNIKRFWKDFSETQIRNKLNKIREATENLNREVECVK